MSVFVAEKEVKFLDVHVALRDGRTILFSATDDVHTARGAVEAKFLNTDLMILPCCSDGYPCNPRKNIRQ